MVGDRSPYGLLLAALGALLLAVSVFLPWYGLGLTEAGAALARHLGEEAVGRHLDGSLQAALAPLHASLGALTGRGVASVSAHQALHYMSVLLLVLAGLALLDALTPLAAPGSPPDGAGAALALLGGVASVCVVYRMIDPPTPTGGLLALSLRGGAWLALSGSLAILAGGLWPRLAREPVHARAEAHAWSVPSGWTPER